MVWSKVLRSPPIALQTVVRHSWELCLIECWVSWSLDPGEIVVACSEAQPLKQQSIGRMKYSPTASTGPGRGVTKQLTGVPSWPYHQTGSCLHATIFKFFDSSTWKLSSEVSRRKECISCMVIFIVFSKHVWFDSCSCTFTARTENTLQCRLVQEMSAAPQLETQGTFNVEEHVLI